MLIPVQDGLTDRKRHCHVILRYTLCLLVGYCVLLAAPAVFGAVCTYRLERSIIDAALNLETDRVETLVSELDMDRALIPSSVFYVSLANWYDAYQSDNQSKKNLAIEQLRNAFSSLRKNRSAARSLEGDLGIGIAAGHLARILFDSNRFLAGYRMAIIARTHLERFFSQADESHAGYPDAALLSGLFEIYTHDLKRRGTWLPPSFSYQGDRRKGIQLIEMAISNQSVFASEAARALLAEVPWRKPDFCRYINLVDFLGSRLDLNLDLLILRQGLLLRCGFPKRALKINQSYSMKTHPPSSRFGQLLQLARMRIFANLGKPELIASIGGVYENKAVQQVALANALDVAGNRQKALEIYRHLANSRDADKSIRTVAEVRQRYPFRSPMPINIDQFGINTLQQCR